MIAYIKNSSGQLYASPIFAEIGRSWDIKSVVLNENGDNLILLPYVKNKNKLSNFNYYYIDETIEDGWITKKNISGFSEIINNKAILKEIRHSKNISIESFECVKLYNLPLQLITKFAIKNEQDIAKFNTVSWGLHDSYIEKIDKTDNNIVINFNTTWGKHIIITFGGVKEIKALENINCILNSELKFDNKNIIWNVIDMISNYDYDENEKPYIVAKSAIWELLID